MAMSGIREVYYKPLMIRTPRRHQHGKVKAYLRRAKTEKINL